MIRIPVVKGQFYPETQEKIKAFIEQNISSNEKKALAKGIILPHAGFVYSGKVAAVTVSKIMPKKRLIILGPNHTGMGRKFALWSEGEWQIPGSSIPIDKELCQKILESGDTIEKDILAHQTEHSIEVELPILNFFLNDFSMAPIACMSSSAVNYEKAAQQICKAIKSFKEEILFVASSDMTHYEPDQVARKKDRLALERITNLDALGLVDIVDKENISMCGVAPVAIMLLCLKILKAHKAQVTLYQTSAEVSGDYSSVVGYAGVMIN